MLQKVTLVCLSAIRCALMDKHCCLHRGRGVYLLSQLVEHSVENELNNTEKVTDAESGGAFFLQRGLSDYSSVTGRNPCSKV